MAKFRRKTTSSVETREAQLEKFRGSFLKTLSEVIFSDELEQSTFCIASGIRRAFDSDVFIFKRKEEKGEMVAYSNADVEQLSTLLLKAGLRLDVYKIELSGERERVFDAAYTEFDNPFPLIGDLTTSAACKKIQRELGFNRLVFSSVETDDGAYTVLVLLPDKALDVKQGLSQFALLIKYATYLAALKKKLREFENRFDEQIVQSRRELAQKESAHLVLFDEMPIAAALLDERGVIAEANQGMRLLFADEGKTVGQPLSSLVREDDRRSFIEFLVGLPAGETAGTEFQTSGKHFKAQVVSLKNADGERAGFVVYLVDHTSEINLERELGRTIDALRAENEAVGRRLSEEKKFSEGIISNAGTAIVAISGQAIAFASEGARRIFEVTNGQGFDDFLVQNSIHVLSGQDSDFKVTTPDQKTFAVTTWHSGEFQFYLFNDITPLRLAEEQLGKSNVQLDRVFNSLLPTALVKEGRLSEWNEAFGNLFADYLSASADGVNREKSLDGFLLHIGESPEVCRSELQYNNLIRRTCRTVDRRSFNVSIVNAQESTFIFVEDFTEQENAKQQFRNVQSLLTSTLESFSEEPIFIVENNVVSIANLAARNKLGIKLDEAFTAEDFSKKIGVVGENLPFKLREQFYRLETAALGSLNVYRLRLVNEVIAQQSEINRLRRRQEIFRELSTSDRYEGILDVLNEIVRADGIESARLVSSGIMLASKDTAEVYLLNVASGKVEPSLSLSLSPGDVTAAERGGFFSRDAMLNTTFSNVVSAGEPALLIESTTLGDTRGFAAIALRDGSLSSQIIDELGKVLKAASSSAVGIHARLSSERKFEESGRVINALVGLSGIGDGSFEEVSRKAIDSMKGAFGGDSAGIYSAEGSSLRSMVVSGDLPDTVPLAIVKYDTFVPGAQFESHLQTKSGKGSYFAVKSRSGTLVFLISFVGALPAHAELKAILSAALEILESRKLAERESAVAAQLSHDSQLLDEFMEGLAKSTNSGEVIQALENSLSRRDKDAAVTVSTEHDAGAMRQPPG
ncbi:MAG: PAS domain-containing protein, partial [Bacteroidetes bacterium]|nr:PAS domain-containing protein [Bacteroidota bacterium]